MNSRLAWAAVLAIAGTANAWGGVALESFGIEPTVPHLFNTIGPLGTPGAEAGPGASVAWPVTINTALLNRLPASMQVNFPDRSTANLSRLRSERSGNALFWEGQDI